MRRVHCTGGRAGRVRRARGEAGGADIDAVRRGALRPPSTGEEREEAVLRTYAVRWGALRVPGTEGVEEAVLSTDAARWGVLRVPGTEVEEEAVLNNNAHNY